MLTPERVQKRCQFKTVSFWRFCTWMHCSFHAAAKRIRPARIRPFDLLAQQSARCASCQLTPLSVERGTGVCQRVCANAPDCSSTSSATVRSDKFRIKSVCKQRESGKHRARARNGKPTFCVIQESNANITPAEECKQ